MSRKMIDYKVENGKITSIDGYEVGGGGGYKIKKLTVTQNGLYNSELEAYNPIYVNVPQVAQSGSLKALLDGTKSTQYLFFKYQGTSVDGLISYGDTANVTNMSYMFNSCPNLTSIPALDASKATNMSFMFSKCTNLTSIPALDTSRVNDMNNMFYECTNLTAIPELDTSSVTNMSSMFYNCRNLTTIPALDASSVTNMDYIFYNCSKLTEIHMRGIKEGFDIHYSTLFTREALVEILNNLARLAYSRTLTMGETNLAKLTEEDKKIATDKGWRLE